MLAEYKLEAPDVRRQRLFIKFAQKTEKNITHKDWFPLRPDIRTTRSSSRYSEEYAAGSRLYNSPLFAMRRSLNNTETESQLG